MKNSGITSALSVAKYIIGKGIGDKLCVQKLTYISYGYYYHYNNDDLFDDEIQAWKYGPVVPTVYYYKGDYTEVDDISENEALLVDKVLDIYARQKPFDLVKITHKPNTPWSNHFDNTHNKEIPKDEIKSYYKKLLTTIDMFQTPYIIDAFK